jgi:hypothetical protein
MTGTEGDLHALGYSGLYLQSRIPNSYNVVSYLDLMNRSPSSAMGNPQPKPAPSLFISQQFLDAHDNSKLSVDPAFSEPNLHR